jgi:Na+/glutamate symporter
MTIQSKVPVALLLLASPLAAFAGTEGAPTLEFLVATGGAAAAGGFIGALLACWLCNRRKAKHDDNSKKY